MASALSNHDLVVVALSGVQRLITESRRTSDLSGASTIVTTMAQEAVRHLTTQHNDVTMVFPAAPSSSDRSHGVPNKIVALLPEGTGTSAATDTVQALDNLWRKWIHETFGQVMTPDLGWPNIQWVCAPAELGDYAAQWREAQEALRARKTVHDFSQQRVVGVGPCELSPRWSAIPAEQIPERAQPRDRGELSATSWVKRLWHRTQRSDDSSGGAPPTNAIASAHYRAAVLEAVEEKPEIYALVRQLFDAAKRVWGKPPRDPVVPGLPEHLDDPALSWMSHGAGLWVYPETWQEKPVRNRVKKEERPVPDELATAVGDGRDAAESLIKLMAKCGVSPPSAYLAVLTQDLDSMGEFLSGHGRDQRMIEVSRETHQEISAQLQTVARAQRDTVEDRSLKGKVVYAGGDDLLALVPAVTALEAALRSRRAVHSSLPRASTAVHFFHHASPLQSALRQAQTALDLEAKTLRRKNGLAVSYRTSSGMLVGCRRNWESSGEISVDDFALFQAGHLSPRLVWDLESSDAELSTLKFTAREAELRRLVTRHFTPTADTPEITADTVAEALDRLRPPDQGTPLQAAKVSVFLSREAR